MIPKIKDKPTMVIAGPGAGKTHDMVHKVLEAIPSLKPNRVLAAITFTNAATDSIKERLHNVIHIPPNVFVGTNYSFFNQFILLPFATLFDYVALDKLFLEIDVKKSVDRQCNRRSNPAARNAVRTRFVKRLLEDGKVPFEQIASVSAKLMENTRVRDVVCNRIEFLFKDEFQDTDTVQMKIFDAIRKGKKTFMYSVGDPEQYILGFTYTRREVRKPHFDKIPINRFASDCNERKNHINKRACSQLVEFTNNFHTSVKQESEAGKGQCGGVFYICDTDLDDVTAKFIELTEVMESLCERPRRLLLAYENRTFAHLTHKYGLLQISNDNKRPKTILGESLDLISSAVQLSSNALREKHDLDLIGYRKLGVKLMHAFVSQHVRTTDDLKSFLEENLDLTCQNGSVNLDSKLNRLLNLLCYDSSVCGNNYYSSIHKAKGLEAESVLVVAKNESELRKWLATDKQARRDDRNDTCRIGYVGFTRAKRILCIACKQTVGDPVKSQLRQLGAEILH
ncbi:MAG: UvrD-helicase domain-containing protein [Candidatus Zixiibacteriota bacterium]